MLFAIFAVAVAAPVDQVLQAAAAREAAEDPAGALELLEPWYSDDTQSYALALRVGWLAFEVEDYALALSAYARAAELSAGGLEPRLGLAWTHIRLEAWPEARALHAALATEYPQDHRVVELGDALSSPTRRGALWATVGGLALAPHHAADVGAGAAAGGSAFLGSVTLGGALGARSYALGEGAVPSGGSGQRSGNGGGGSRSGWGADQTTADAPTGGAWASGAATPGIEYEGWARLGAQGRSVRAELVGAALLHTNTTAGGVVGVSGSVTTTQEWRLQLSWTRPRGTVLDVFRAAPSAWVPVGPFAIQPQAVVQAVAGRWLPSGSLTLWWTPPTGAAWLGGQYGASIYETDVALGYATAYPDHLRGSVWIGGRIGAPDARWISVQAVAQWVDPDGSGPLGVGLVGLLDLTVHTNLGAVR